MNQVTTSTAHGLSSGDLFENELWGFRDNFSWFAHAPYMVIETTETTFKLIPLTWVMKILLWNPCNDWKLIAGIWK